MEQRNVNSQHKHNEQTQAYLEQIRGRKQDEGERSEEMDRRRELVRKHTLFSAHLDRALKFKMIEENQPFWMPPIVRSRDFDKFVAYPPKFQCFSHKTRAIEKTLHPCWNDACFVAGVCRSGHTASRRSPRWYTAQSFTYRGNQRKARAQSSPSLES